MALSEERGLLEHYLIVGHGSKGLELPHIFSDPSSGEEEEILPVFSTEEGAREFLRRSSLGEEGWYVRGFSGGELVSVLFAFHATMKGVLLDPQPEVLSSSTTTTTTTTTGEGRLTIVGRNAFVSLLLETRSHPPPPAPAPSALSAPPT